MIASYPEQYGPQRRLRLGHYDVTALIGEGGMDI